MKRTRRKSFVAAPPHVRDFLFEVSRRVQAHIEGSEYHHFRGQACRYFLAGPGDLDADIRLSVGYEGPPYREDCYLAFTPNLDAEEKFHVSLIHPRGRRRRTFPIPVDVRISWMQQTSTSRPRDETETPGMTLAVGDVLGWLRQVTEGLI